MADSPSDTGGRSPWRITLGVWYAMFLRETVSRTMTDRMGWFWMVFEPLAYTMIFIWIRGYIRGDRLIVGADFIPWLITGLMGFFMVREGMLRGLGAVDANQALFAYRQVQPVDPVIVRSLLDGVLRTFVFLLFIAGALLLGVDLYPDDGIAAAAAWLSLWFLGLSLGLFTSVAGTLVPEVGKVIRMLSLPLMILSGVIFPLNNLPHWLLEYLMWNPIPHGLETLRHGFFNTYRVIHGTSMLYFWLFTLTTMLVGLLMHLRFKRKLIAK